MLGLSLSFCPQDALAEPKLLMYRAVLYSRLNEETKRLVLPKNAPQVTIDVHLRFFVLYWL